MLNNLLTTSTNQQLNLNILGYIDYATSGLEKILFSSQDKWFESKWFIAILGSMVGIIIITIINESKIFFERRKQRKIMAKNFFGEITMGEITCTKGMDEEKKLFDLFVSKGGNGEFDYHPSIQSSANINVDYYNTYLKDIGLFDCRVQMKVMMFYSFIKNYYSVMLALEKKFEKFYTGDKTISKDDIIKVWTKKIKQGETIPIIAAMTKALLISKYKIGKLIYTLELKNKEGEIISYLKGLKEGEKINIYDIAVKYNIDLLFVAVIFVKQKTIIDRGGGEFEKN